MDRARWEQIQSVFHEALAHPPDERMVWLESACREDRQLKTEVLAMLEADAGGGSLLDRGLSDMVYKTVATPFDPVASREFGPYRLRRILGEGGMGVVWLAERKDAGNPVAIKFLPHATLSPSRLERFAQEIRMLAKLKHPCIARLYDAGTLPDGTPWFVMEYVEGVGLTAYCRERKPTLDGHLRLFRSICEAVRYAQDHGITHRDLIPSYIVVEADGTPRLLDFGIARELRDSDESTERTQPGLRFLSPGYAAPEWSRDGIVGTYTDVYSLGVILYEMLAGRLPSAREGSTPERPSVAGSRNLKRVSPAAWNELDVLCLKALEEDPARRYRSAEALLRDVDHYVNGEPLEAKPDTWRYRGGKFVGRHRAAVLSSCAALALIVCLTIVFTVRLAKERNAAVAAAVRTQRIQRFMLNLFQGDDKEAGPAGDLRVVTLIDRGVTDARGLGNEPAVQAELYQTLGTMYQRLGKLDRAESLLQSALKERRSLAEPDYAGLAENLIALGLLRSDQGKSDDATKLVHEALAVIGTHESGDRPLQATANSALGEVLAESGKYAEAAAILNRVLASQSATAPNSPELSETLSSLADAQLYLGHYELSDSLNRRALAIDRRIFGDNHPHVSDDLGNMAQLQENWGHYAEAERYERQALAVTEAWYGKDHPDTARKMTTLASTLIYEGKNPEADDLLTQALATQVRVYGNNSHWVAYVVNLLGGMAQQRKDFPAAETDFRRAADIYRAAYGDGNYKVAVAMGNIASLYFSEKRYPEAEQIFREVVQRFTKIYSPGNINTGQLEIKLGRTLLAEKRYREAEAQTRAGYEVLIKQTSPSTSYIVGARKDLVAIYEALGRPEDARKFRGDLANAPDAKTAGPK